VLRKYILSDVKLEVMAINTTASENFDFTLFEFMELSKNKYKTKYVKW